MTIRKFIAVSIAVHIIIVVSVYLLPKPEIKKPKELHARLVSPDEFKAPQKIIPLPMPVPKTFPVPKRIPVIPHVPQARRGYLPTPLPEKSRPSPEKPLVMGEGRKTDKSLKESASPTQGTGKEGEGIGRATKEGETTGRGSASQSAPSDKPGFSPGKLFDKGVLDRIARRETEGKKGEPGNPMTFDTKEYRYSGYMTTLKDKIESIWVYPPDEAAAGHYGDLKIRFTIKKDGSLGEVVVERTSGYPSLDKAALKALKDGEPYWPLPDEWHRDSYTILGHFIYNLYGYHLR